MAKSPNYHELKNPDSNINDFMTPEFKFDTRGRLSIPLPGYSRWQLTTEPGSKIISQGSEDENAGPNTSPGSLKTGSLHADTVITIGDTIALNAVDKYISVGSNPGIAGTSLIMSDNSLKGLDGSELVFGFFLEKDGSFGRGDFFVGNYPTSYLWFDQSTRTLKLAGDIVIHGDVTSANYVADVSGYKLTYLTGSAEFQDVIVRGTVYMSAGEITGGTISSQPVANVGHVSNSAADIVPTSLSVSDTGVAVGDDGVILAYVTLTWDAISSDTFNYYMIKYKKHSHTYYDFVESNTNTVTIDGLMPNVSYDFAIASVNKYGVVSVFSTIVTSTSASDTSAPSTPTGLSSIGGFKKIVLDWDSNTEYDLNEYYIYRHTANDSSAASKIGVSGSSQYIDDLSDVTYSGGESVEIYYYWVKAVDTSRNESDFSDVTSTKSKLIDEDSVYYIGAAKILLDGTTYLTSWRHSSDFTKIDGGDIYANSVTVSQVNFTVIGTDNIIGTINSSAEGIEISAKYITISGTTVFNSGWAAASNAEADIDVLNTTHAPAVTGATDDAAANSAQSTANSAQSDANTAQTTADGKAKVFRQATAPATGMVVGDVWFKTDEGDLPYSYTGAAWSETMTVIDGGRISAATIDAYRISTLSMIGKTCTFDTGSIGGWIMTDKKLYKTNTYVTGTAKIELSTADTGGAWPHLQAHYVDTGVSELLGDSVTMTTGDTADPDPRLDIRNGGDLRTRINKDGISFYEPGVLVPTFTIDYTYSGGGGGAVNSVTGSGAISCSPTTGSVIVSHSTSAGYVHLPAAGTAYYMLRNSAAGTGAWTRAVYIGQATAYLDCDDSGGTPATNPIVCSRHFKPTADNTYDLGGTGQKWNEIWCDGGLKVGTDTPSAIFSSARIIMSSNSSSDSDFGNFLFQSSAAGIPGMILGKARGSAASPAKVATNDYIGGFLMYMYTGASFEICGHIISRCYDTPSAGYAPADLILDSWRYVTSGKTFTPKSVGSLDLGTSTYYWDELYCSTVRTDAVYDKAGTGMYMNFAASSMDFNGAVYSNNRIEGAYLKLPVGSNKYL